ncbi:MAG: DUF6286 domain-containing protein [Acidimicrobiia bacterium]
MRVLAPALTRLLAALMALALVAGGVLICVEVLANWIGDGFVVLPGDWPDQLRTTEWSDQTVRAVSLGLAAGGVLLLLAALWPRPPLTVDADVPGLRVERHSLERLLGHRLDRVEGVSGSRVRVGRRRVRARVDTTRRLQPETVREQAEREIAAFCERHRLALRPDVRLRTRGGRS